MLIVLILHNDTTKAGISKENPPKNQLKSNIII